MGDEVDEGTPQHDCYDVWQWAKYARWRCVFHLKWPKCDCLRCLRLRKILRGYLVTIDSVLVQPLRLTDLVQPGLHLAVLILVNTPATDTTFVACVSFAKVAIPFVWKLPFVSPVKVRWV